MRMPLASAASYLLQCKWWWIPSVEPWNAEHLLWPLAQQAYWLPWFVVAPHIEGPEIKDWAQCYLHWIPETQIRGGSRVTTMHKVFEMMEEVQHLQEKIRKQHHSPVPRQAEAPCLLRNSVHLSSLSFHCSSDICLSLSCPPAIGELWEIKKIWLNEKTSLWTYGMCNLCFGWLCRGVWEVRIIAVWTSIFPVLGGT